MKRILISVVCGVLIVCLMFSLWCLQNLLKPVSYNTVNQRGLYKEDPNSLDMIYVGGSAAFMYWSPMRAWHEHGMASYVFGTAGIPPQAILPLMKEASLTQSPKLWVIDARPFQYGNLPEKDDIPWYQNRIYIRNVVTGLHPLSPNKAAIILRSVNFFDSLDLFFDIQFYRNNFELLLKNWKKAWNERHDLSFIDWDLMLTNEEKHSNKGFQLVAGQANITLGDLRSVTDTEPMDPLMLGYLDEVLTWCRENDQQVLFIVHSYRQSEAEKCLFNGMQEHVNAFGYELLNTNDYLDEIGYDTLLDFCNPTHTNIFGAEKYTDFVADYLIDHYALPDHRGESAYADWDACYVDYERGAGYLKQTIRSLTADF